MNSPFIIPIVAIIFGCSIPIVAIWANAKKTREIFELYHRERMAAIDKGIELPPLPDGLLSEQAVPYHPRRNLRKGLVWAAVGAGMLIAFPRMESDLAYLGFIPLLIGVAYLIYYAAVGRKEAELADAERWAKLGETKAKANG